MIIWLEDMERLIEGRTPNEVLKQSVAEKTKKHAKNTIDRQCQRWLEERSKKQETTNRRRPRIEYNGSIYLLWSFEPKND